MNTELKKRLNNISDKGLDSILLTNIRIWNPNFFYFTNSNLIGLFLHDFNSGISKILTSDIEYEKAKKTSWIKNIVQVQKMEDTIKQIRGKTLGIDKSSIDAMNFERMRRAIKKQNKNSRIVDVSKYIRNARAIKTPYEINCIKQACRITEKIYKKSVSEISKKLTELELKAIIETNIARFNVSSSFPAIVATENNIRIPHHEPGKTRLKKPVLIDFGVCYKGYNSDVSRTIGSKYEKLINNVISEIEQKIEPGVKAEKIDSFSRTLMGKYAKYFITSLGHGIGIETHEQPSISKNSKDIFKEGMTFAIEPGIYVKNGIRTENNYLLTKRGLKSLSGF